MILSYSRKSIGDRNPTLRTMLEHIVGQEVGVYDTCDRIHQFACGRIENYAYVDGHLYIMWVEDQHFYISHDSGMTWRKSEWAHSTMRVYASITTLLTAK